MDTLVQQVQQLSNNADASVRHQISRKLRELAATVETPRETMTRYAYSVSFIFVFDLERANDMTSAVCELSCMPNSS